MRVALERRNAGGHEQQRVETKLVAGSQPHLNVPEVDRVERSADDAELGLAAPRSARPQTLNDGALPRCKRAKPVVGHLRPHLSGAAAQVLRRHERLDAHGTACV